MSDLIAPSAQTARRAQCARCLRPQSTCICRWIVPVENAVDVLFLQHPLETGHAKGSAQLLHQSLKYSALTVGEAFDHEVLKALLFAPVHTQQQPVPARPALLYPADHAQGHAEHDQSRCDDNDGHAKTNRLIVLDGTWRKSRKMLHLNPLLQQLPRVSLADLPPSRYRIRKAHREDQLSSFEATCHALMQLEDNAEKYRPLLAAFDGFIAQQQSQIDQHRTPIHSPTPCPR